MWVPKRLKQLWDGLCQYWPWRGQQQPASPPGGKGKDPPKEEPEEDPLVRAHRERPCDQELAERHRRKYNWSYGVPALDEPLKDEVIVVNERLLSALVMSPQEEQQVGMWVSTRRELYLLCTQRGNCPHAFEFEGRKLVLNRLLVTFADASLMPGRAITVRMREGWTAAYRYLYLLLLPPRPAQGGAPLGRPEVPDADDRDDE